MDETLFTPTGNWDNHKILLRIALMDTNSSSSPILELGCGDGSSPALQAFVKENHRELLSYDYDKEWADKYGAVHVADWDYDVDWNKRYSVALVDESPGEQRHKSLMLLKNVCDIVILHDSEPSAQEGYMLDKIWHLYRYKVDLVSKGAWATALSNTYDVTQWIGIKQGEYEVRDWSMRDSIAFCSIAFDDKSVEQQRILKESILKIYPNAPLFFYEQLPQSELTQFKSTIIKHAWDSGFRKVVWMDPKTILNHALDYPKEMFIKNGVLTIESDNKITEVIAEWPNKYCLPSLQGAGSWLEATDKNSILSSFYFFDFKYSLCRNIFDDWHSSLNEINKRGMVVDFLPSTQRKLLEKFNEIYLSVALYNNKSHPLLPKELDYNQSNISYILLQSFIDIYLKITNDNDRI